jgi:hypothetical protein
MWLSLLLPFSLSRSLSLSLSLSLSFCLSVSHSFSLLLRCVYVRAIKQNLNSLALPYSDHFSSSLALTSLWRTHLELGSSHSSNSSMCSSMQAKPSRTSDWVAQILHESLHQGDMHGARLHTAHTGTKLMEHSPWYILNIRSALGVREVVRQTKFTFCLIFLFFPLYFIP